MLWEGVGSMLWEDVGSKLWEDVGSMLWEGVGSMRVPVHGMGHSDGQGWEIVVAVIGNVYSGGQQTTQDPANEVPDDQVSSLTIANWPEKQAFLWPMEIESGLRPEKGGFFWPTRGETEQWPGKRRVFLANEGRDCTTARKWQVFLANEGRD